MGSDKISNPFFGPAYREGLARGRTRSHSTAVFIFLIFGVKWYGHLSTQHPLSYSMSSKVGRPMVERRYGHDLPHMSETHQESLPISHFSALSCSSQTSQDEHQHKKPWTEDFPTQGLQIQRVDRTPVRRELAGLDRSPPATPPERYPSPLLDVHPGRPT